MTWKWLGEGHEKNETRSLVIRNLSKCTGTKCIQVRIEKTRQGRDGNSILEN